MATVMMPILWPSNGKPLPSSPPTPTPTTFKMPKLRPRIFVKRRHRTISSEQEMQALRCEREPSAELTCGGGNFSGTTVAHGDQEDSRTEGTDETDELWLEWLCREGAVRWKPMEPDTDIESETMFRCDIFATSGQDFAEAEKECKQLVIEAGGTIIDGIEYLGRFMYNLPSDFAGPAPLESSDETLLGGYIRISSVPSLQPPSLKIDDEDLYAGPRSSTAVSTPTRFLAATDALVSPPAPRIKRTTSTYSTPRIHQPSDASPLQAKTPATASEKYSSPASTPASATKDWPRPKDPKTTKRAGEWVKAQAARRKANVEHELRSGTGMEVVGESKYEGGVQAKSLYMDGFSDLAVWMGAAGGL